TTTSSPLSHALQPVVRTTCGLRLRFTAFCSVAPVQKWIAPSSQTATSGVTGGRSSARTVVIQNSSAVSSTRRVSSHLVATASASLNRGSSSVTGAFIKALLSISTVRHDAHPLLAGAVRRPTQPNAALHGRLPTTYSWSTNYVRPARL